VIQNITQNPSKGIPKDVYKKSQGIAIFPNVNKAGFIFGGMFGKGVLINKLSNGEWSKPSFISIGGGSVGFQIGIAGIALVLMVMNETGVENIAHGNLTLGADIGIATGPIGRNASIKGAIKSGILSYSTSQGLFAGISLEGGIIAPQRKNNTLYYGEKATVNSILFKPPLTPSPEITKLLNAIKNY